MPPYSLSEPFNEKHVSAICWENRQHGSNTTVRSSRLLDTTSQELYPSSMDECDDKNCEKAGARLVPSGNWGKTGVRVESKLL
mmetsp:Transcript_4027/g.9041  ORF Transcript_4027/g.9041 Transcript_4027/m.9041 type:complete len:83 (+) Transcript_4027:846-1094(+)